MSRLTNHFDYCECFECKGYDEEFAKENMCKYLNTSRDKCLDRNIYNKLVEYEDLEEQGLLLKLPCKIGNTVYVIDTIYECKYDYLDCPNNYGCEVYKELSGCEYEYEKLVVRPKSLKFEMLKDFNKTVFLTKEEAEQELKRLECTE